MALIDCPECEKKISEKAVACPHCGYPMRETRAGLELPFLAPLADFAEIFTETLREFTPRERKGERHEERKSRGEKSEADRKGKRHRERHNEPKED